MNAIQQISLKLRLGLDPGARIAPSALRALWNSRVDADHAQAVAARAARARRSGASTREARND